MSKFNLRRKPRISYCEYEEPNIDEYVYCDKCTDFVYEYCSIHGPPLVIPDDDVSAKTGVPSFVPRAALTIPQEFLHLAPSIIPGAGLGVFSTLTLPRDVRFGPYRGHLTKKIDSMYCWQLHDGNNKWSHAIDAADTDSSNWMRYVNCARHYREQNLVAYQYQGEIYYRTIKIVPRFTELMVFYGGEFAQLLGISLQLYNEPLGFAQIMVASFSPKTNEAIPVDENENEVIIEKCTGKQDAVQDKSKLLKRNNCRKQGNHNKKITKKKISRYTVERNSTKVESCQRKGVDKKSRNRNDLNNNAKDKSHHQSTNIYICDLCKKKFIFKNQLESHIQTHELKVATKDNLKISSTKDNLTNVSSNVIKCNDCKQAKGKCNICNIKQNNPIVTLKGNQKTYECNQSGKYAKSGKLKTHVSAHSGVKPHKCDICDKAFTWFSHLKLHLLIHSNIKPHKCDICDKAFTLEGNLKRHLLYHSGIKPHKCDICDKAFTEAGNLKKHILFHSSIKPHKCDICDKAFTLEGTLKGHLLFHSGIKPHKCDICDKAFTWFSDLKRHLLVHSGVKPHKCDICDKAFKEAGNLKKHIRSFRHQTPQM